MTSIMRRKCLPLCMHTILKTPRRNGYIVLLPEVSQLQETSDAAIFKSDGLPEISNLSTDKCISTIAKSTLDFETGIWKIEEKLKNSEKPSCDIYSDVLDPLEKLGSPLDATWGLMKMVYLTNSAVLPRKCYLGIHDRARLARSRKFYSKSIYNACKEANTSNLSEERKRVVEKFILEGHLNGLDLKEHQKARLKSILNRIGYEKSNFRAKVEISTRQFKHDIRDHNVVHDFPENLLKSMSHDRSAYNSGPWTVTLQPHTYSQFMEYCPDRELRWNAWQAYVQRSAIHGETTLQTSTTLEQLRSLRGKQAKLLGFSSFAEMSMQTKMAGSVKNVQEMLARLLSKAYPAQKNEIMSLEEFAKSRGFEGTLQLWDIPYWKRKKLKTLYSYDEDGLREYFPLPQVLGGLFRLCHEVFGLQIVESNPGNSTWNPDVKVFHILDANSEESWGTFYLDPYSREGDKVGMLDCGGWMVAVRNRSAIAAQKPLAALIFSFQPPEGDKPSLLTFKEVQQLFQKFGHALQHLLTTADYSEVSGLSNIEWDAVEICSNLMTHWLFHSETLQKLSGHYITKEPLPEKLLESIEKLPHALAGYDLCQQLYLASLDMELHIRNDFWLDIVKELWPKHFVLPRDKRDAHPCSFTDIFSEEWGAAYYSHVWSKVVAADAFSAFQEAGLNNTAALAKVGSRFRSTFLALGGSCHPAEVFRRFRGRDPSPNALLWSLGLKKTNTETPVDA